MLLFPSSWLKQRASRGGPFLCLDPTYPILYLSPAITVIYGLRPRGSPALVSCVYTVPFLLVGGWEGGFSLNRGYTYVFLDVETFTMCWT